MNFTPLFCVNSGLGGRFSPKKKIYPPPPPKKKFPDSLPLLGTPPSWDFQLKADLPPVHLAPRTSPLPSPSRQKIKNIRNVHQVVFLLRKTSTIRIGLLFRNAPVKSSWTDLFFGLVCRGPKCQCSSLEPKGPFRTKMFKDVPALQSVMLCCCCGLLVSAPSAAPLRGHPCRALRWKL